MAVTANVFGVEENIVIHVSDGFLEITEGKLPIFNPDHPAGDGPIDRVAELILQGDWLGWMEDNGEIPFETFAARVASGENMSYSVKAISTETNLPIDATSDPTKPTQIVYQIIGESANGNRWMTSPNGGNALYIDEDGTRVQVVFISFVPETDAPDLLSYKLNSSLSGSFYMLGLDEKNQGKGEVDGQQLRGLWESHPELTMKMFYGDANSPSFNLSEDTVLVAPK